MRSIEQIKADIEECSVTGTQKQLDGFWLEWFRAVANGIEPDRLEAICKAEMDGRCMVLPCPFYSEVYALSQVGNEIIHGELRSTNKDYCLIVNSEGNLTSKGKTWHGVQVRMQDVFPTRPEAEAALASAKQVEASAVASEVHKLGGEQE